MAPFHRTLLGRRIGLVSLTTDCVCARSRGIRAHWQGAVLSITPEVAGKQASLGCGTLFVAGKSRVNRSQVPPLRLVVPRDTHLGAQHSPHLREGSVPIDR